MNELRIDEIAFAAGCHQHKYWNPNNPDLEGFIINHKVLDKFAELIVRECVGICDDVQRQYGQYTFTATKVKEEIKERFGVE